MNLIWLENTLNNEDVMSIYWTFCSISSQVGSVDVVIFLYTSGSCSSAL